MAGDDVLEIVRHIHHRSVLQPIPIHIFTAVVGHVRAQFRVRVRDAMQTGPVVRVQILNRNSPLSLGEGHSDISPSIRTSLFCFT